MTRVVAILSAYGFVTALPIFFVFQPFFTVGLPGIPIRYGDFLDLLLTPWIGVGAFALLYLFIPKASDSPTGHKNLYRVLFWTFSVLYVEGHGMHLAANSIGNNLVANTDARLALSIFLFDEPIGHLLWLAGAIGLALIAVGLLVLNYSPEAGVPYAANSTNPVLPPLLSTTSKRRTLATKSTANEYGWVASGSSKGP